MSLRIVPATRESLTAFVQRTHRHLDASVGDVFRLACVDGAGVVRGVASVGRPVARALDDGRTLEVNRCAVDGVKNGSSFLYAAALRTAFSLGWARIYTYTLPEEGGASLRALKDIGWKFDGEVTRSRLGWASRSGREDVVIEVKHRWVAYNQNAFAGEVVWPEVDEEPPALLRLMRGEECA